MAMVELAAREHGVDSTGLGRNQVSLAEIAQAQRLSLAYLEQLFGPLRRAGLVTSARGPGGGYRLARGAGQISICQIVHAVDEPIQVTRCEEGSPGCLAGQRCLTHDLWAELGDQIRLFLEGMTLADVIGGQVTGRATPPRGAGEPRGEVAG
jgi:Rrf2 family iron-sulfur cluster assembly transcriptional regulator